MTSLFRSQAGPDSSHQSSPFGGNVTNDSFLEAISNFDIPQTWADIHLNGGAAGNLHQTYADELFISWQLYAGLYSALSRSGMTFDTTSLGVGATIISASLSMKCKSKSNSLSYSNMGANIYGWNPHYDACMDGNGTDDWGRFYDVPFSTAIGYTTFVVGTNYTWVFNAAGLAAINAGGITRLAIRESTYDAPNVTPPSGSDFYNGFTLNFYSADYSSGVDAPVLEVVYVPGGFQPRPVAVSISSMMF
jgi:hypothetical protein